VIQPWQLGQDFRFAHERSLRPVHKHRKGQLNVWRSGNQPRWRRLHRTERTEVLVSETCNLWLRNQRRLPSTAAISWILNAVLPLSALRCTLALDQSPAFVIIPAPTAPAARSAESLCLFRRKCSG
jgi:hypothetical protein